MEKPVSEEGATQVARVFASLNGQQFLREVDILRSHPVGQQLLRDKPDLASAISADNLVNMPEGSFGALYYQQCCQDDTLPGYLLGGLIYRDGFFDALDVDDDTRWYIERMSFNHDATHIISDYKTDLAAEALNIMFNLGHQQSVPRSRRFFNPFGLICLFSRTTVGWKRWRRELTIAYDRGTAAAKTFPQCCIPYEELMSKPITEVREFLGISPLPSDWDTSHWCLKDPYADMSGEQKAEDAERIALVDGAVRAGFNWREYMRADAENREQFVEQLRQGAGFEQARSVLA
jgi:ubiquinone biosynthesis protein Coq4